MFGQTVSGFDASHYYRLMYNWLRNTLAIDATFSTVAHLEASYPHFAVSLSLIRSCACVGRGDEDAIRTSTRLQVNAIDVGLPRATRLGAGCRARASRSAAPRGSPMCMMMSSMRLAFGNAANPSVSW